MVTGYYSAYEEKLSLAVRRPVHVLSVSSPDRPDGSLVVATDAGTWRTSTLVSATGKWDRPHWPYYPGRETFRGRQLHTHDFRSADEFRRPSAHSARSGVERSSAWWVSASPPVCHPGASSRPRVYR